MSDKLLDQTQKTRLAAEAVLLWAKDNNLFRHNTTEVAIEIDEPIAEEMGERTFSSDTTLEIFKKKSINMVLFDEENSIVTVLTANKLTKAEEKALPFQFNNGVEINYLQGGLPQVKVPLGVGHIAPVTHKGGVVSCGSSIHPVNSVGAGTIGAIVRDQNGDLFGLTNNHVSAGSNYSTPSLPILCPGPLDGNRTDIDPFTIGRHHRLLALMDGLPENVDISKNIDAALFKLSDPKKVSSLQGNICDTPSNVIAPYGQMKVEKVGRTTGHTRGRIIGVTASPLDVHYTFESLRKIVYLDNVWMIQGENGRMFSESGDSGSLVMGLDANNNRCAVGLIFAGNTQQGLSFMLPLNPILTEFGVTLVDGHNAKL